MYPFSQTIRCRKSVAKMGKFAKKGAAKMVPGLYLKLHVIKYELNNFLKFRTNLSGSYFANAAILPCGHVQCPAMHDALGIENTCD